ncbi:MAG: hypothetical protein WCS77_03365 [Elusimicrobiaceae bacterium]
MRVLLIWLITLLPFFCAVAYADEAAGSSATTQEYLPAAPNTGTPACITVSSETTNNSFSVIPSTETPSDIAVSSGIGREAFSAPGASSQTTKAAQTAASHIHQRMMAYVNTMHSSLSDRFLSTVGKVDNYFGDRYFITSRQESAARISLNTSFREGGVVMFNPEVDVQISMPKTQNRFNIVFNHVRQAALSELSATDRLRSSQDSLARAVTNENTETENATFIGLRYAKPLSRYLANHIDLGVDYSFLPKPWEMPKPYASYNLNLNQKIGRFLLRQDNQMYWQYRRNTGYTGAVLLTYNVSDKMLLNSELDGNRTVDKPNWSFLETVSLNWIVSDRDIITPLLQTSWHSTPAFSDDMYTVAVSWRRRLYEQWMFFGAVPQIDYPQTRAFRPKYSMTVSVEFIFGFITDKTVKPN